MQVCGALVQSFSGKASRRGSKRNDRVNIVDVFPNGGRQRIIPSADHLLAARRMSVCGERCVEYSFCLRHGERDLQDIARRGEGFYGCDVG